jgi:uncharacterized membrane protein YqhA
MKGRVRSAWLQKQPLLKVFFALRGLMLMASVGSMLGAGLMLWLGGLNLYHAYETLIMLPATPAIGEKGQVVAFVLDAVDAFLFALVLVIFAYGIALGFVFHHIAERFRQTLPSWMLVDSVAHLKRTLAEVVIVVLIVLFARVVIEADGKLRWELLVLPVSVVFLALALRLLAVEGQVKEARSDRDRPASEPSNEPASSP